MRASCLQRTCKLSLFQGERQVTEEAVRVSVTCETVAHFLKEAGEAICEEAPRPIRRWTRPGNPLSAMGLFYV